MEYLCQIEESGDKNLQEAVSTQRGLKLLEPYFKESANPWKHQFCEKEHIRWKLNYSGTDAHFWTAKVLKTKIFIFLLE